MDKKEATMIGLEVVETQFKNMCYVYNLPCCMSKEDLEDLKQDCTIEMLQTIDRYKNGAATLKTFLTCRVRGFLIDQLRKRTRQKQNSEKAALKLIDVELFTIQTPTLIDDPQNELCKIRTTPELLENLYGANLSNEMITALSALPSINLYIILSKYLLNKGVKEIALELNYKQANGRVYQLLKEALQQLREVLQKRGENEI